MSVPFAAQDVPNRPGVYIFRNAAGEVIYVGKATSLRKRLASYFQPSRARQADPKLRALIHSIGQYETMVTATEAEALLLESRLIKQYHPRYNVELRDDKRFLHICVDPAESFPRLQLVRLRKEDGRIYFGPFPRAGVLRQTVAFLCRRFGLRSCAVREPGPDALKHCLDPIIRDCLCPCRGSVTPEEYGKHLEQALDVLRGDSRQLVGELRQVMEQAAADQQFERAAELRDVIGNLRAVSQPNRAFGRTTLDAVRRPDRDAVQMLARALGLAREPKVIECFDISNISGRLAVASMVCFREGRPSSADYRRFRIRATRGPDDAAMMHEAVHRRYTRLVREQRPLPDLVVVDGGRGQLAAALEALAEAGVPSTTVLGLAKRQEEIFLAGGAEPLTLPRHHPGLKLLQAVRDEAHRFANAYHRSLRRRRIANSVLYEIPGIGAKRCAELLRTLGSAQNVRDASPETIAAAVPGLGLKLAGRIVAYLNAHRDGTQPG
ncbi:MAG: excinuclease ABC subunit UvrC [Lentisphaeria bacterium]|nr:excinuclease ABC subunit UvrC [Lentisphaeria bacterium]